MLAVVGASSVDDLIDQTLPSLDPAGDATGVGARCPRGPELMAHMRGIAGRNKPMVQIIGQGYYGTHTPPAITAQRAGKPGLVYRLHALPARDRARQAEALLNFQTMVADLTGLEIANAFASG